MSSRGAHVGLWPRTHTEHAVSDGSLALFLLEPVQESRVEGFGPVHAEVGRDRIKAAEQMSAHGNPHGDRVWMSWHASHPSNPPRPYTHLTGEVVSRIIGTGGYTQRWLYLHGCIGEPDACVFGRGEPKLQSDDRRGQGHRTDSARRASRCSSSDWEPSAFETRASPIRMCRKRSFGTLPSGITVQSAPIQGARTFSPCSRNSPCGPTYR